MGFRVQLWVLVALFALYVFFHSQLCRRFPKLLSDGDLRNVIRSILIILLGLALRLYQGRMFIVHRLDKTVVIPGGALFPVCALAYSARTFSLYSSQARRYSQC